MGVVDPESVGNSDVPDEEQSYREGYFDGMGDVINKLCDVFKIEVCYKNRVEWRLN